MAYDDWTNEREFEDFQRIEAAKTEKPKMKKEQAAKRKEIDRSAKKAFEEWYKNKNRELSEN